MRSRGARAGVVVAATILPAILAWRVVGAANPPHHDLSDAATGLMQLVLAALAAVVGLTISVFATRRRGPD